MLTELVGQTLSGYTRAVFWKRGRNRCGYWGCRKRIPREQFLCEEHYERWTDGFLDRCPKCGRFKDVMYRLCFDCYFGRKFAPWKPPALSPVPEQSTRIDYSDAWVDGYMRADRFFIYIIEFDSGDVHIGHAEDLRKALSEFSAPMVSPRPGSNPKLRYTEIVATEKAAELREDELKKLMETNPQQVRLMVTEFRNHMREFGLEDS